MTTQNQTRSRGEILKQLRTTHAESVKRAQVLLKEQKHMQEELCSLFRERPRTVPEAAQATGIPADKVLWFLAAMKKYGIVVEAGMCGDYPLYKKAEEN
jgi:predicted Rossmann fold nucleotide-binding protein DprA/Smf involved in DNA uptake